MGGDTRIYIHFGYVKLQEFIRDKVEIVISFVQPLLWLVVFAAGFGARLLIPVLDYQQYLFPGIIRPDTFVHRNVYGCKVIWDKRVGFMKEILNCACYPRFFDIL